MSALLPLRGHSYINQEILSSIMHIGLVQLKNVIIDEVMRSIMKYEVVRSIMKYDEVMRSIMKILQMSFVKYENQAVC